MDCPAGRRILARLRNQPARIHATTDGAIDRTTPPDTFEALSAPIADCPQCGQPAVAGGILIGWVDCGCAGAEAGGHRTHECESCGCIVYTTRHTENDDEESPA